MFDDIISLSSYNYNMKTLLILKNELSPYNVPVYNEIAKCFDLTIGYYKEDKSKQQCNFKKVSLSYHKIGPFIWIHNLGNVVNQYDLICIVPDLHVLSYCLLPFGKRSFKIVNWGIGFRVSYVHPYITNRKHNLLDKIYQGVVSRCDASIFYMEKAKEFWKASSFDMGRVFVAPNTADVCPIEFVPHKKRNFLFVGTLYRGKGLDILLNSFQKARQISKQSVRLVIVGDGEMRDSITSFVEQHNLQGIVELKGAIFDEKVLADEFQNALLCISPTQAGLSCPKSMGYGVPFVCRNDAITGGEMYHITSGVNGISYDHDQDLTNILIDAMNNPDKYVEMGRKAKMYYEQNATIVHMAQGAIDAFNYALDKRD